MVFEVWHELQPSAPPIATFSDLMAQERAAVNKEVSNNERAYWEAHDPTPQIKEYLERGAPEMLFAYPLVPAEVKEVAQAAKTGVVPVGLFTPQIREYLEKGAPSMPFAFPLVPQYIKDIAEIVKIAIQPEPDYAEMQRLEANKVYFDITKSYLPSLQKLMEKFYAEWTAENESAHTDDVCEEIVQPDEPDRYVEVVKNYSSQISEAREAVREKCTNPVTGEFTKNLGWGTIFGREQNGDNFHITVPNPPSVRDIVTKSSEIRENWGRIHGTSDADRKNPERTFGPESGSLEGRIEVDELKKEGQLERRVHAGTWSEIRKAMTNKS